jgi:hypothetical protein
VDGVDRVEKNPAMLLPTASTKPSRELGFPMDMENNHKEAYTTKKTSTQEIDRDAESQDDTA